MTDLYDSKVACVGSLEDHAYWHTALFSVPISNVQFRLLWFDRYFTFPCVADIRLVRFKFGNCLLHRTDRHTPYLVRRKNHCSLVPFRLDSSEGQTNPWTDHETAYQPHARDVHEGLTLTVILVRLLRNFKIRDALTQTKWAFGPFARFRPFIWSSHNIIRGRRGLKYELDGDKIVFTRSKIYLWCPPVHLGRSRYSWVSLGCTVSGHPSPPGLSVGRKVLAPTSFWKKLMLYPCTHVYKIKKMACTYTWHPFLAEILHICMLYLCI